MVSRVCIFSYGYWFRKVVLKEDSALKCSKTWRFTRMREVGRHGIETASRFIGITWSHQSDAREREIFITSVICLSMTWLWKSNTTLKGWKYDFQGLNACVVTFLSIVFYYSNNSKSYFVDEFLHISLVWSGDSETVRICSFFLSLFPPLATSHLVVRRRRKTSSSRDVWAHEREKRWKIIKLTNDLHYPYVEKTA